MQQGRIRENDPLKCEIGLDHKISENILNVLRFKSITLNVLTFKVNNKSTRKLFCGLFVNFAHASHLFSIFLLLVLNSKVFAGQQTALCLNSATKAPIYYVEKSSKLTVKISKRGC